MSFSHEWDSRYQENTHMSIWPWRSEKKEEELLTHYSKIDEDGEWYRFYTTRNDKIVKKVPRYCYFCEKP